MRMRRNVLVPLIVLVLLAAAAVAAAKAGWFDSHLLVARARALRAHGSVALAAAAFVAAWSVATPVGFPALPLIVTGGALFGTVTGTLLSMAGTGIGALGGYFVARALAPMRLRRWLESRLDPHGLGRDSRFMSMLRLRLVPIVPFSAVNYASGLAAVPLATYLATTLLGQLPSTLLYTWFADRLLRAAISGGDVAWYVIGLSALLLLLSVLPRLLARALRPHNPA